MLPLQAKSTSIRGRRRYQAIARGRPLKILESASRRHYEETALPAAVTHYAKVHLGVLVPAKHCSQLLSDGQDHIDEKDLLPAV